MLKDYSQYTRQELEQTLQDFYESMERLRRTDHPRATWSQKIIQANIEQIKRMIR